MDSAQITAAFFFIVLGAGLTFLLGFLVGKWWNKTGD